jgi:predicted nucleic acid-binding protein
MVLLDSEALSALAHGPNRRRDRVRALIHAMRAREEPVAIAAAVLAEVVRGRAADAGVFAGLRREAIEVHNVDSRVGVRAGQLLGRVRAGSEMAIDAFTIAIADLAGGAVVATADPGDLERLAAHGTNVVIVDIT